MQAKKEYDQQKREEEVFGYGKNYNSQSSLIPKPFILSQGNKYQVNRIK